MATQTTTTTTTTVAVTGTNEKANVFILQETQVTVQTPPVFILNSDDFINLQKYVFAGMALPSTATLFESEFPEKNMETFMKSDMDLYKKMREVLPRINNRCTNFQIETLEPMITLGGRIANFAKDAGKLTDKLLGYLQALGSEEVKMGTPKYKSNHTLAQRALDKLITHAVEVDGKCQETLNQLDKFKVDTMNDKKDLDDIAKRLKAVIPSKEHRKSKIGELIQEARNLVNAAKKTLDEETEKARQKGKLKWYHFIPVIGTIILIVDTIKHQGLLKTLRQLNDNYEAEKKKGAATEAMLLATSSQVDHLADELESVESTIQSAMTAVEKMQKTFSNLKTSFEEIKRNLNAVNTDMNSEEIEQRICAQEDLADAIETWNEVYTLAKVFQQTGLVLDAKTAPKEITDAFLGELVDPA
ncbi:hypothetical protein EV127DRAFT_410831 [Xylaria flabelliformis]|nr:hypothetical protein EV127DRAFT_410831 [Xylaria flabelliformis]